MQGKRIGEAMKDMSEEKERSCCEFHKHKDQIKSLVSRLKDAQDDVAFRDKIIDQKISQNETFYNEIKSLEQRLSKAEAKFKEVGEAYDNRGDELFECQMKLSHLMDVAGNLARTVGNIVRSKPLCSEPCSCCNYYEKEAKLALAEWDGIKKQ